ncbi:hypothetical protein GYMLUDRAFT_248234 [Collybiopsis luxurians FD-317 M1]|uniref:JmjC domain-containing protein n=1 Tax=Collybiopsis luxurians FD-317 M1 TaxID=944289 RepID=A0A0D0BME6_9AGAR|nr:hypothetical protein GYMLUDRAFT_248234 [Collybiopsis luxurians FD-317 M1]
MTDYNECDSLSNQTDVSPPNLGPPNPPNSPIDPPEVNQEARHTFEFRDFYIPLRELKERSEALDRILQVILDGAEKIFPQTETRSEEPNSMSSPQRFNRAAQARYKSKNLDKVHQNDRNQKLKQKERPEEQQDVEERSQLQGNECDLFGTSRDEPSIFMSTLPSSSDSGQLSPSQPYENSKLLNIFPPISDSDDTDATLSRHPEGSNPLPVENGQSCCEEAAASLILLNTVGVPVASDLQRIPMHEVSPDSHPETLVRPASTFNLTGNGEGELVYRVSFVTPSPGGDFVMSDGNPTEYEQTPSTSDVTCPPSAPLDPGDAASDRQLSPLLPSPSPESPPPSPIPRSPPPLPRPKSPATASTSIPPPKLPPVDLLSDVVGKQVHAQAETIVWPSGWETVLPTLIENGQNILEADTQHIRWMADPRNAVPDERSMVKYLDSSAYEEPGMLIEKIRSLNVQGFVVVIPGAVPDKGQNFASYHDLKYRFGLGTGSLTLQYHNLKKRVANDPNLHTLTTVPQFAAKIYDPDTVGVILDLPIKKLALPEPYEELSDSAAALSELQSDSSFKGSQVRNMPVHPQNFLAHTWGLLHHAGVVTHSHQDAEGYNMWGVMSFKDPSFLNHSPEELAKLLTRICLYENIEEEMGSRFDESSWGESLIEIMYLCPGDMFFQPPGVVHLVYTPAANMSFRSHYYNYNTMHLTEWTRRIQHLALDSITNQRQIRVQQTLNAMMIHLPNFSDRVFYVHVVAALCKMVLAEHEYLAQGQSKCRGNDFDRKAKNIALLIAHLCLDAPTLIADDLRPSAKVNTEKQAIIQHLNDLLAGCKYNDPGEPFMLGEQVFIAVEEMAQDGRLAL